MEYGSFFADKDSNVYSFANNLHERISTPLFVSTLMHELALINAISGVAGKIKNVANSRGKNKPEGVAFDEQAANIIANSPYLQILFDELNIDVRNFFIVVSLSPIYGPLLFVFKTLISKISSDIGKERVKKSIAVEIAKTESDRPGFINSFAAQGQTKEERQLAQEIADMAILMLERKAKDHHNK